MFKTLSAPGYRFAGSETAKATGIALVGFCVAARFLGTKACSSEIWISS